MRPSATMCYFAVAGLLGGAAASLYLWSLANPEYRPAIPGYRVLGFDSLTTVFVFPFVAAALAAFWVWALESQVGRGRIGVALGAAVATLSFLTFNLLLAAYVAATFVNPSDRLRYTRLEVLWGLFTGYSLFGGLLFGWALVALGGVTGWLASRDARHP